MNEIRRLAWERMQIITGIIGDYQGKFIAVLFYVTVLVPFGLGSRLFSDPLRIRKSYPLSWLSRDPLPTDLTSAKRQG